MFMGPGRATTNVDDQFVSDNSQIPDGPSQSDPVHVDLEKTKEYLKTNTYSCQETTHADIPPRAGGISVLSPGSYI